MKIGFKNTEVSYLVSGNGSVVVWLHGFLEHKFIWEKQLLFFNNYFTNIIVDLLGHGNTGNVSKIHTMDLHAKAVMEVLNHLKVNQFSVVGHSMGGYVGLSLLEKCNGRVTHFALLNSTSYSDTIQKKQNRDRALKIIYKQKDSFIRMGIINLFSKSFREKNHEQINELINEAEKMSVEGVSAALLGMKNRKDQANTLSSFKGEKIIISGKKDTIFLTENSLYEAKETNTKLIQLDGGHMSYLEATKSLNECLFNFFELYP